MLPSFCSKVKARLSLYQTHIWVKHLVSVHRSQMISSNFIEDMMLKNQPRILYFHISFVIYGLLQTRTETINRRTQRDTNKQTPRGRNLQYYY